MTKNDDDLTRRDEHASSIGAATASAVREGCAHTPAPWRWFSGKTPSGMQQCVKQLVGSDGQGFALTVGLYEPTDTANARLIAAAPELLAEFKDQLRWLDRGSERYSRVVALIAKAEGR